jgi:hypothetical protein
VGKKGLNIPADNVLVWLPTSQTVKHRKIGANGHLPNDIIDQPPEYPFHQNPHHNDHHQQHHPATVTHRDPEITKIIKKPNRHFRLYVVSFDYRMCFSFWGFLRGD